MVLVLCCYLTAFRGQDNVTLHYIDVLTDPKKKYFSFCPCFLLIE